MFITILSVKSLSTPDSFPIDLVNAENMESCSICSIFSETGFISEQLCMKTFVEDADDLE